MPFGHAVFFKKYFGTSNLNNDQTLMYMCSLVGVFCCRHFSVKQLTFERGSYMVWKINMGVCPRLEFDNIMFINCRGMTFIFMVHLIFYAILLLIYDVMYDITTMPLGT